MHLDAPSGMEKYTRLKLLGKGTFGKAWKVRDASGLECVAKQIKCENKQDLEDALAEAHVLSKLNHTHIVSYVEVIKNSAKLVTIVMEFCGGGDVGEKIARRKFRNQYFDEATIQLWMIQASDALNYLHQQGILHRDVKPANLFLATDATLRLGDFGIARILDRNAVSPQERTTRTPVGTPMYFSPEMCHGKRYGQKADIWALGCVLYELASLRPAFMAHNMDGLTAKIKRGHHAKFLPSHYGAGLRQLVAAMLSVDEAHRPTALDVLHSKYLGDAYRQHTQQTAAPPMQREVMTPKKDEPPNIMVLTTDTGVKLPPVASPRGSPPSARHHLHEGAAARGSPLLKAKSDYSLVPSSHSRGHSPRASPRMRRHSDVPMASPSVSPGLRRKSQLALGHVASAHGQGHAQGHPSQQQGRYSLTPQSNVGAGYRSKPAGLVSGGHRSGQQQYGRWGAKGRF
eukprot:m.357147 g.357147  ORF g.357147 m.357147 type:complete len:457 (+) comp17726_c0_seq1:491-1861(+)